MKKPLITIDYQGFLNFAGGPDGATIEPLMPFLVFLDGVNM